MTKAEEWMGEFSVGVDLALRRLRKLHVLLASHESSQLQEHHLDAVGVLPLGQCSYGVHVNLETQAEVPLKTQQIHPSLSYQMKKRRSSYVPHRWSCARHSN